MESPVFGVLPLAGQESPKLRRDRPCDACRKRKSRCVVNEGAKLCVLCEFHRQECTFLQTPLPRKRRLTDTGIEEGSKGWQSSSTSPETEPAPRKLSRTTANLGMRAVKPAVKDYADLKGPSLLKRTLGLQIHRHSRYIGPTAELEPSVVKYSSFDRKGEGIFARNTIRKVNERDLFLMQADESTQNYRDEIEDLDTIESVVAPHGQALVSLYFRIVHPSFPILHKRVFLEKYDRTHREFSPPLLAAVYILALNWWSYSQELADLPKPDVKMLEKLALKTMGDVIQRPKLSTVQAGLLLLQRPEGDSWSLTAQLIVIGHGLGLHLDCSSWRIPPWEQGLRRRLAWGLYMQDKWSSLIDGRPPQIYEANWMVKPVSEQDFPESAADEDDKEGSTEVEKGMILFTQMIALTRILAEVLDTFFSLRAIAEIENEGENGTHLALEKAKPVQIKLRDWFTALPECLRMGSTKVMKLSSTGYLHLAYFTTEITLHRCIIRSIISTTPPPLQTICRLAAKARLLSAIDFVDLLRPEHLQSFWYFASKINLGIIGSFGCLLWATSDGHEEAEFYKARLGEYKWTLRVRSKGVQFMEDAMGMIEASIALMTEWWDQQQQESEKPQSHLEHDPRPLRVPVNGIYNRTAGISVAGDAGDNNGSAQELHLQQQQEEERSGFQNGHDGTATGRDVDDIAGLGYSAMSVRNFTGNKYEYEYEYDTTLSFHSPQAANETGISVPHSLDTYSSGGNDGVYEPEVALSDSVPRAGMRNSENGHFAAWPAPAIGSHEHWINGMT